MPIHTVVRESFVPGDQNSTPSSDTPRILYLYTIYLRPLLNPVNSEMKCSHNSKRSFAMCKKSCIATSYRQQLTALAVRKSTPKPCRWRCTSGVILLSFSSEAWLSAYSRSAVDTFCLIMNLSHSCTRRLALLVKFRFFRNRYTRSEDLEVSS